jgi:hypothetical protein
MAFLKTTCGNLSQWCWPSYMRGLVFYSHMEKNVHDRIISLRRDVWACQTSSTPLFIEEHYQARKVSAVTNMYWFCLWRFLRFSDRFWNCSDAVVFFVFHFITLIIFSDVSTHASSRRIWNSQVFSKRTFCWSS